MNLRTRQTTELKIVYFTLPEKLYFNFIQPTNSTKIINRFTKPREPRENKLPNKFSDLLLHIIVKFQTYR